MFIKLWLFVSSTYSFNKKIKDKYPRLPNIICKKSILSIDNFQKEFTPLVIDYYSNFYKRIIIYEEDILSALKFKYKFVSFLEEKYPHTFKNKDYYHFYYDRYIKPPPKLFNFNYIKLPIVGFTDDCKIIYNCNGVRCILQGQVLVTI